MDGDPFVKVVSKQAWQDWQDSAHATLAVLMYPDVRTSTQR